MENILNGRARRFGDDINTDYIIAGKYTKTLDFSSLAEHLLEDLIPGFSKTILPGDMIVAGRNFGCGSSREQAPIAIRCAGIAAVLAKSYSRIFFRNAINQGIPAFLCDTDSIAEGDRIIVNIGSTTVELPDRGTTIPMTPLSPVMLDILKEGGLVEYLKRHGGFVLDPQASDRPRREG